MAGSQSGFIRWAGRGNQLLGGNGVVVGPEGSDDDGTADPVMTLEAARAAVKFLSRDEFEAWVEAYMSKPAVAVYSLGRDGAVGSKVLMDVGTWIKEASRPAEAAPSTSRTYEGRLRGNTCFVTVRQGDDRTRPLPPRLDLRIHSPSGYGYGWGYGGSGPVQLSLGILADAAGDAAALDHYQDFKADVIARLDQDEPWTIEQAEVLDWLARHQGENP